jgi:hypothetical protein
VGTGSAGKPRQAITKLKYKYTSSITTVVARANLWFDRILPNAQLAPSIPNVLLFIFKYIYLCIYIIYIRTASSASLACLYMSRPCIHALLSMMGILMPGSRPLYSNIQPAVCPTPS